MLFLGDDRDALGGENGVDAHFLEVVLGAPAEDLAELLHREIVQLLHFLFHLAEVLAELFLGEELREHGDVHVFATPLGIDEADGHVEGRQDFLDFCRGLAHQEAAFLDDSFRFLPAAEEGVELVDNV